MYTIKITQLFHHHAYISTMRILFFWVKIHSNKMQEIQCKKHCMLMIYFILKFNQKEGGNIEYTPKKMSGMVRQ